MPILLGCGLGAAVLAPVVPPAAVALSWIAGAAAAWIAFSARLIASLPYAQTSSRTVVLVGAGLAAAAVGAETRAAVPSQRARSSSAVALVPLAWLGWWALHPPPTWSPPHGPPRLVPRRRAGRRHPARDAGRGDAGRRRPTRGTRRPPVAAHGPALARGDRHLPRAPRSRRGRPRRVAVAGRRCGDRPDATGAGDRRADDAGDGPPARCPASSRPGWDDVTRSDVSTSASSGPTTQARPTRTRTCTARSCSRATARSISCSPATPSRR